jgi:transposase
MGKTRPAYPPAFKTEAVRLARTSGKKISEIARDIGVSDQSLRNWIAQADIDEGKAEGLTTDERAELRRLRSDNKVLREEREILKKAAAFFAKEGRSTP